jgi:hypothetical protein
MRRPDSGEAARRWGVSKSTAARWIARGALPVGQTIGDHVLEGPAKWPFSAAKSAWDNQMI